MKEKKIKKILDDEFTSISLTEREIQILEARMKGKTYKTIGKEFNVTLERIRQIEKRARIKKDKKDKSVKKTFNKIKKEIDKIN